MNFFIKIDVLNKEHIFWHKIKHLSRFLLKNTNAKKNKTFDSLMSSSFSWILPIRVSCCVSVMKFVLTWVLGWLL